MVGQRGNIDNLSEEEKNALLEKWNLTDEDIERRVEEMTEEAIEETSARSKKEVVALLKESFNYQLGSFSDYLSRRKGKQDFKSAEIAMANAIKMASTASKKGVYDSRAMRQFFGDSFLRAAQIADQEDARELAKKPLMASLRYANSLGTKINDKKIDQMNRYIENQGTAGTIQRVNLFSRPNVQDRFDSDESRLKYADTRRRERYKN